MGRFYAIFKFFVIKSLFMDIFGCFSREINLEFDSLWLSLAPSIIGAGLMLFLKFFGINLKFFRYLKFQVQKSLVLVSLKLSFTGAGFMLSLTFLNKIYNF